MKSHTSFILFLLTALFILPLSLAAQQGESIYGDDVKANVKMNYVYSLDEALQQAKEQKKPIFFNCFADWAVPCHSMNKAVFSDQSFCDYMNKNFINLFVDVTTPQGRPLASQYNIKFFAHYLVLDSDGNILLRMVGGKKLPEFKEDVMLALSPKTSLAGTSKKYATGKFSKEDLLRYAYALDLANDSAYDKVSRQYLAMLSPKEYTQKENWEIFARSVDSRTNPMYIYLVDHKNDFVKSVGAQAVNDYLERLFMNDVLGYANGTTAYDATALNDLEAQMNRAQLSDSTLAGFFCRLARLRGERNYDALVDELQQHGKRLREMQTSYDLTLDLPEMTAAQKSHLVTYLRSRQQAEQGRAAQELKTLADNLENYEGITFEKGTFAQAIEKATGLGRPLFMDCYTSWCGPCKMMSSKVFTLPQVGKYFNDRFVSIKMDMEKGEGKELATRYKVAAYPTMLLIGTDGNVEARIVGARSPQDLVQNIQSALDPVKGYKASKAAYEGGSRTGRALAGYLRAMKMSQEMDEAAIAKMSGDFLAGLSDTQFSDTLVWPLIEEEVNNPDDVQFTRLLNLHDALAAKNGTETVNKKVERVLFPYVLQYFDTLATREAVMAKLDVIARGNYPAQYTLNLLHELVPMSAQNNVAAILSFYDNKVAALANPADRLNIDVLLYHFVEKGTLEERRHALDYARKQLASCDSRARHSYTDLVDILQSLVDEK